MQLKFANAFEVVSELPEPLAGLRKLAMNFRWTWDYETQHLFHEVDPDLWEEVEHNPLALLERCPHDRLEHLAQDPVFLRKLLACTESLERYLNVETWFDREYPGRREHTLVAYFCAEFGLHECLPIYSGGLGVLAGDHLKAASDLGIPLVGIGLLYARGYFRQFLNQDGWQQEHYPRYDFYRMPLQLVRDAQDQPVRVEVEFPDRTVTCQIWKAQVGRVDLYLLDSNVLDNVPDDQSITDTLYGGDEHMRIRQEMILGIGGMRALRAIGLNPTVCHMNEGHAGFLSLERIRQTMQEYGVDFRTARQAIVAGNVFTTHTPVPAGIDVFHPDHLEKYLLKMVKSVGLDFPSFLRLGRFDPDNASEPFNMAVYAMEHANHVNGVSRLHGEVSRRMFKERWKDYPLEEVPITSVTNGIHTMSWISRRMEELLDLHLGPQWREDPSDPEIWDRVADIPDGDIWEMRESQRNTFIRYCRQRLARTFHRRQSSRADLKSVTSVLDPRILTIGFARRFATYKRATLLLSDRERLKSILFHPERPVQIVFAGKSHPRDDEGKRLIQAIHHFIEHEGAAARMLFLEDYDIGVTRAMVQGVDVWLNNPRRPNEASGTSGMKAVPNGVLNCSILDGWWAEAYRPGLGFAIGDELELPDWGHQDWLDSRSLYQVLEQQVAPLFYDRDESGVPRGWVKMIKNAFRELAPRFSTARMVREYTTRFYLPASQTHQRLMENGLERAKKALVWRDRVRSAWPTVRIVKVADEAPTRSYLGDTFTVRAWVDLGKLSPEEIRVQVVEGQVTAQRELTDIDLYDMELVGPSDGVLEFATKIACEKPGLRGYIVRVVPYHDDVNIASELSLVCWQPTRF